MNRPSRVKQATASREKEIDCLKFLAAVLVVVLHVFLPGSKPLQEGIYLLGSYGIPVFFLVNGYLLAKKPLDFSFAVSRSFRYAKFILVWAVLIGTVTLLWKHELVYLSLIVGVATGGGVLFHLWFLLALCIVYFVMALANIVLAHVGSSVLQIIEASPVEWIALVIMGLAFIADVLMFKWLGVEIRDVVLPPLRIVTSLGYFIIGMALRFRYADMISKNMKRWGVLLAAVLCMGLCSMLLMANVIGMKWASSYYNSPFVVIGVVALLLFFKCKLADSVPDVIESVATTSTGIWILHPYVSKLLILAFRNGSIPNLIISTAVTLLTVITCSMLSNAIRKNKYLSIIINI